MIAFKKNTIYIISSLKKENPKPQSIKHLEGRNSQENLSEPPPKTRAEKGLRCMLL